MNQRFHRHPNRTFVVVIAACMAIAANASPSFAKPKDACGILALGDLQRSFPGATITPPERRGIGGCAWAAEAASGDENRITITVRYDDSIRWPMDLKENRLPDPANFRMLSGIGTEAFYSQIDGVYFRKAGFVVDVSVIGSSGATATAPKEIDFARYVASKFSGLAV